MRLTAGMCRAILLDHSASILLSYGSPAAGASELGRLAQDAKAKGFELVARRGGEKFRRIAHKEVKYPSVPGKWIVGPFSAPHSSTDRSAHNASSYPSFGAHVAERSTLPLGPRYGAGRAAE